MRPRSAHPNSRELGGVPDRWRWHVIINLNDFHADLHHLQQLRLDESGDGASGVRVIRASASIYHAHLAREDAAAGTQLDHRKVVPSILE
jgi:hypothetical protein